MSQMVHPLKKELNKFQAIILAGGRGSRLSPHTDYQPKPLLQIRNKPILQYLIEQLESCGVGDITIGVRYLGDQIIDYFGNKYECVNCNSPTMIESFVYLVKRSNKDHIVGLSGDTLLTSHSIKHTVETHLSVGSDATLTLSKMEGSKKKWRYIITKDGFLEDILTSDNPNNLERSGLIINRNVIDSIYNCVFPIEESYRNYSSGWNLLFKLMIEKGMKIFVSVTEFPVQNINTVDDLKKAESFILKNLTQNESSNSPRTV